MVHIIPNKLLLDPYARELKGRWTDNSALLGYLENAASQDLSFDRRDSAPYVPKSAVSDPALLNHIEQRNDIDWSHTLIYEAHVKGATMEFPGLPETIRGTYEGLASDAVIEHLKKIGITAVELLPVHSFIDDSFLIKRKLRNYWGYNTIGFNKSKVDATDMETLGVLTNDKYKGRIAWRDDAHGMIFTAALAMGKADPLKPCGACAAARRSPCQVQPVI